MFVMTMTKRKLIRAVMFVLVLLTGIAIGVFAILSSIDTGAENIKLPIYNVKRTDNKISITFDCAWGNSNTDKLISILAEADAKATFFVTGEFADKYADDIKKLSDAGHEIANHSDKHPHIKGMNVNDLIADTKECSRKIKMITGNAPMLYRAPYGEYDDKAVTTLFGMGMSVIQWNKDSIDWDKPTPETIIERTTKNISGGSILLFHNDLENTAQALPTVLKSLKEQGFELCTVSELLLEGDYIINSNGTMMPKSDSKQTVNQIVFSDNDEANTAFETLAEKLSISDIDALQSKDISIETAQKLASYLTAEQIAALKALPEESLYNGFVKLKEAVYARENNTPGNSTEPIIKD